MQFESPGVGRIVQEIKDVALVNLIGVRALLRH